MSIYGYVSETTQKGSKEKQKTISAKYGEVLFYTDTLTEAKNGRPHLYELLAVIQPGDTIIFYSLKNISDSPDEGISIYQRLFDLRIEIIFICEPYFDSSVLIDSGLNNDDVGKKRYARRLTQKQLEQYFIRYQEEIEERRQRLQNVVDEGGTIGRQKGSRQNPEEITKTTHMILNDSKTFGGQESDEALLKRTKISRSTFYRLKKDLLQNKEK